MSITLKEILSRSDPWRISIVASGLEFYREDKDPEGGMVRVAHLRLSAADMGGVGDVARSVLRALEEALGRQVAEGLCKELLKAEPGRWNTSQHACHCQICRAYLSMAVD